MGAGWRRRAGGRGGEPVFTSNLPRSLDAGNGRPKVVVAIRNIEWPANTYGRGDEGYWVRMVTNAVPGLRGYQIVEAGLRRRMPVAKYKKCVAALRLLVPWTCICRLNGHDGVVENPRGHQSGARAR